MSILVMNTGSSSIKFRIIDVTPGPDNEGQKTSQSIVHGILKRRGTTAFLEISDGEKTIFRSDCPITIHEQAVTCILKSLKNIEKFDQYRSLMSTIEAVGHRVVHGGDKFCKSIVIDDFVLKEIEQFNELAPLHNPACLAAISEARQFFGHAIPMVAVFDTAFYHLLPAYAATYAIPYELSQRHRIRRYGFHGIAHASLAETYAHHTGTNLNDQRLITMQLGNGCSMTAMTHGQPIDTSMGFSPCEGLIMGTRSGDLDPSIIAYLAKKEQVSAMGIQGWLNEHSGLLGISGTTNDMQELLQASLSDQDSQASLAIDMFCYRIRKYLGAYLAILEGSDAIVFGGGIGENAPDIRSQICEGLEWLGIQLNQKRNESTAGLAPGSATKISEDGSAIAVYAIGTDEESWIASETARCVPIHQSEELTIR